MRTLIVGVAAVVTIGWSNRAGADESAETWYEVQVDSVAVDAQRPGNAGTWDEAKQDDSKNGLCTLVVTAGVGFVSGGTAALGASQFAGPACELLNRKPQQERDPKAPDLLLRLSADGAATYWSGVAWNSYQHDFSQKFYVPASGIPTTGIKLSVLDQDGADHGSGETIATIRLTKKDLEDTANDTPPVRTFTNDGLKKMELIVRPAALVASTQSVKVSSSAGMTSYAKEIPAGATVEIRAAGKYKLGGLAGSSGPTGVGTWSEYNLKLFKKARHGAAVAVLSDPLMGAQAAVVGTCTQFVSAQTGQLSLGVNDHDPGNNSGDVVFKISITPPTLSTWRTPGAVSKCTGPSPERAAIAEKVVAGIEAMAAAAAAARNSDCDRAARDIKTALDAARPDFEKAAALQKSEDIDASDWFEKTFRDRIKAAMKILKPVAEKCERNEAFAKALSEISRLGQKPK